MTYHKSKVVFIFISFINACFLLLIIESVFITANRIIDGVDLIYVYGSDVTFADLNPTHLLIFYPLLLFYELIINLFFIFK